MGVCFGKPMHNTSPDWASPMLEQVSRQVSDTSVTDAIRVHSRYHCLPKRLRDDYLVTEQVLGHGMSGDVFLATNKGSQQRGAVKSLPTRKLNKKQKQSLINEISMHLSVDHPNIAVLLDAYESENYVDLVTECMDGGTLFSVGNIKTVTEGMAATLVKQMLLAVQYIHHKSIVHRDLKPENFLLERKYSGDDVGAIKLIDFGVSKHAAPGKMMSTMNATGTRAYTAPEVFQSFYNNKCDIWSLGVITFILLVDYMPFYGNEVQMKAMIMRGNPMNNGPKHRWNECSSEAKQFVNSMLKLSPVDRISAEQALQHPWILLHAPSDRSSISLHVSQAGLRKFARASHFRRACMLIMAWSFTNEEKDQLRNVFLECDTQGKGSVDIQEFLRRMNLPSGQTDELRQVLEAMGEFGYSDFLAAMACASMSEDAGPSMVDEVFRRFDVNQTGLVGKEELEMLFGNSFDCDSFLAKFPSSTITLEDLREYLIDPTSLAATNLSSDPQGFMTPIAPYRPSLSEWA